MILKKTTGAIIIILICGLLASCGGTTDGGSVNDTSKLTLTALLDSTATLTNFESPQEALDLFDASVEAGQIKETPDKIATRDNLVLLQKYCDANNIQLVSRDWGWGDTLTQKLSAAFLAQDGPDIIIGETQMPGFAQSGYLEPFPDDLANKVRNELSDAAWKPMEFNGKIYGVALEPSVSILVWNKKLLKNAGLDTEKAPATWDELLSNIKTVYEKTGVSGGGLYAGPNIGGYLRFGAFLKGAGGGYIDASGKPAINTAENEKAFDFIRQMNKYNKPGIITAKEEGTFFTAFDKGLIAYKVDGSWSISQAKSQGMDCGYSPLPTGPAGTIGNLTLGAGFLAVPTYSKNKSDSFKLIEQMIGNDFQQNIAKAGLRVPVLKSINTSDAYKKLQPELSELAGGLNGDVSGLPTFQGDAAQAWITIGNAMTKVMQTDESIQSILNNAQTEVETAVSAK